jgi:hypothetical protein
MIKEWQESLLMMLKDMARVLEEADPSDLYVQAQEWIVDAERILPHHKTFMSSRSRDVGAVNVLTADGIRKRIRTYQVNHPNSQLCESLLGLGDEELVTRMGELLSAAGGFLLGGGR